MKRYCFLWPFEVKEALGFMNTMQELFIEPYELILKPSNSNNNNKKAAEVTVIPFTSSIRLSDSSHKVIHTGLLTPGATYLVKCQDTREEALNSLSTNEMNTIKQTFQQFDINHDGGISKQEMNTVLKQRLTQKLQVIETQYNDHITSEQGNLSYAEMKSLEQSKNEYLQQLYEAQSKLKKLMEASDIDGNGSISFTEFMLMEAWWLRCTINPERAHLF